MTLHYPFQKLCIFASDSGSDPLLLAASGPLLRSISISTGALLSSWPSQGDDEEGALAASEFDSPSDEDDERPNKKRKLGSRRPSDASDVSVEIVAERKKGERRRPKVIDPKLPNISHLLSTQDGKHAIVATAEDKTVRVFKVNNSGRLDLLNSRSLPKKLCSLKLTTDQKIILTADKFGDVYAIPLFPSPDWQRPESIQPDTVFTPSATELTVHTKGNLAALRQQREQKKLQAKKEGLDFEHKLLLGHVSLLTDLAVAEGPVAGRQRPFILTADRDEHIRVSRGIPQAHIIENYCLGHTEFVSKLCIVPWIPDILIAGSGESTLRVYKWQSGEAFQVVPLTDTAGDAMQQESQQSERLAVAGIKPIALSDKSFPKEDSALKGLILVWYEGLPRLDTFYFNEQSQLLPASSVSLPGNVLDVVQVPDGGAILISLDIVHQKSSTLEQRSEADQIPSLHVLALDVAQAVNAELNTLSITWKAADVPLASHDVNKFLCPLPESAFEDNSKGKGDFRLYSNLGEFLYGLENLRKKRFHILEDEEVLVDVDTFADKKDATA